MRRQEAVVRLDTDGIDTTTVEIGCDATTTRISPRNAKKIQEFVDKNRIELTIVGSRVDPTKQIAAGKSDWDYLINECDGIEPRKKLRDIQRSASMYLPRGRSRTDEFGNTRSGLDMERNVRLTPGKPYVTFRPRSHTRP